MGDTARQPRGPVYYRIRVGRDRKRVRVAIVPRRRARGTTAGTPRADTSGA